MKAQGRVISCATHQVFWTVQLMCGGGTAGDEGLEHASHHHRLHILRYRLVVPRGEVVPKARLVWKRQRSGGGETTDNTEEGWGGTLLTADQLEYKPLSLYNREGGGGKGKGSIKHMRRSKLKRIPGREEGIHASD